MPNIAGRKITFTIEFALVRCWLKIRSVRAEIFLNKILAVNFSSRETLFCFEQVGLFLLPKSTHYNNTAVKKLKKSIDTFTNENIKVMQLANILL